MRTHIQQAFDRKRSGPPVSQSEVPHTVAMAEQSDVSFEGVNNQIGKRLLLLLSPRVTSSGLILQTVNNVESVNYEGKFE